MSQDSLLTFPCSFPIKAMGRADAEVAAVVTAILQRHVTDFSAQNLRSRPSRGGQWVAVTAVIEAQNQTQLDAIYHELSADERIVYAL